MCGMSLQGDELSGRGPGDRWWDELMDRFDAAKGSFGGKLEQCRSARVNHYDPQSRYRRGAVCMRHIRQG